MSKPKQIRACDGDENIKDFIVGQPVYFKCDIEQGSMIYDVGRGPGGQARVQVNVTEGGYSHGKMWIDCNECWFE